MHENPFFVPMQKEGTQAGSFAHAAQVERPVH
jgi:hypothetical protein